MAFDPDAYLAKKTTESDAPTSVAPAFDPDAYLTAKASVPQESTVKDALAGMSQGALMGGADEAGGGLQALLDLGQTGLNKLGLAKPSPTQVNSQLEAQGFKGDIGPTTTAEMYRQGQEETDKDMKAAEKRSPYAYTAGQLAGGVTTGIGTGKLATAGAEALGASKLGGAFSGLASKYSPEVLKDIASYLAGSGKIPSALRGAGKMAALAAPEGAVAGALGSEHNLIDADDEDTGDFYGDVASGAATGSLLGAGLSLGSDLIPAGAKLLKGKMGSYLDDTIDDSASLRQAANAYNSGKEGLNYNSQKHIDIGEPGKFGPLSTMENDAAEGFVKKIEQADSALGKNVGKSLDNATAQGIKINIGDDLGKLASNLQAFAVQNPDLFDDPTTIKTIGKIFPGNAELTPLEVRGAIEELDKLRGTISRDGRANFNKVSETAQKVQSLLRSQLKEQVPEYKNAAARFEEFRRLYPETFLRGNTPEAFNDAMYGSIRGPEAKLHAKVREVITDSTRPGGKSSASATYSKLLENTKQLEQSEAERIANGTLNAEDNVFSKMGLKKPSDFADEIRKQADASATKQQAQGVSLVETPGGALTKAVTGVAAMGRGQIMTAANAAGRTAKRTKDLGKWVYSAGPQQLSEMADHMMQKPSSTQMGQALQDAIKSNDTAKKNAILFSIMQNPNLRLDLSGSDSEDSVDNQ